MQLVIGVVGFILISKGYKEGFILQFIMNVFIMVAMFKFGI